MTLKDMVEVSIIGNNTDPVIVTNFTVNLTKTDISFDINFNNPEFLSRGGNSDFINIVFANTHSILKT